MQRTQKKLGISIQNKTIMLKSDLLKVRELQQMEQLKTNAEIRRRALQADQFQSGGRNNG